MISSFRQCLSNRPAVPFTFSNNFFLLRPLKPTTLYRQQSSENYSTASSQPQDEILQWSSVPTYFFQKYLPRLKIPELSTTCERYLLSQRPLLDDAAYERTKKIVESFQKGEGIELNKALIERNSKETHTSYITAPWFNMYLEARDPIVLNYNPFMCFIDDPQPEYNSQVIRATNMVRSSLRFMKTLKAEILEPEVFHLNPAKSNTQSFKDWVMRLPGFLVYPYCYWNKAFPLDMSQYTNLFSSTRIPRKGKDEIASFDTGKHLLVIRNGHFYAVDVLDQDGNILSAKEIYANLEYVMADKAEPPAHPLGVLTSENRDTWASLRDQLLQLGNAEQLQMIDSALFCLCLDSEASDEDPKKLTRLMLHGDGASRWLDKSFSLIVTKDGKAGVNFEHSWGDGVAVLRYFNEVYSDSTKHRLASPLTGGPPSPDCAKRVRKLEFTLDDHVKDGIRKAKENFDKFTGSMDLGILEYTKFGKDFIKKSGLSPDSLMQLSFQMGFYRQTGKTVPTYESCSTAAFKHGRTETVRSATVETLKCSEAFSKSDVSNSEKQGLLQACSDKHNQLVKDAAMGQGWDRHLFALRDLAARSGAPAAPIFTDPAYLTICNNVLSTSTLSASTVLLGGFGPVVPDGLGVGYSTYDNKLGCNVTSYPPTRDVHGFLDCVQSSLDDIYHVINDTSDGN